MDIKLIVSDIDNTILRTDGTLSPETTAAFELAAAAGVPTVLASSRTPTIASGLLDKVGDLRYMILLTGCRIADMKTGHRIYQRSMERSAALELISYLESQPDCYLEVCSDERFLLPCAGLAYIHRIRAFERYLHDLTPAMIEMESVSRYLAKSGAPVDKLFFYTKHRTHFLDICHDLPNRLPSDWSALFPTDWMFFPLASTRASHCVFCWRSSNFCQNRSWFSVTVKTMQTCFWMAPSTWRWATLTPF